MEILRERQTGTPLGGDIEHQGVPTGQLKRHLQVGFAELIQQPPRRAHPGFIPEAFGVDQPVGVKRGAHQT